MTCRSAFIEARLRLALSEPAQMLSVSDSIECLLGFGPKALMDGEVSLRSRIHPGDLDIAALLFSPSVTPASGEFNIRLRQANGRIRCVRGQYQKSFDVGVQALVLDLLLQDAKGLQQSHGDQTMMANFRAMMENTDDFIFFKDRNHVFTGASQTLVTITDPAEYWTDLLGKTDYDLFPEAYADIYYQLEKQVFAGIPVAREVQEILDKNGKKGWVDNRKYPVHDETGKIIGLFGIARDITEIKRVDDLLAESEQRFRSIFEQVPAISVQGYNRNRQVIFWNPASEKLYGFSREQALGHQLEDLIIPEPMREVVIRLVSSWANGGPPIPAAELILQAADGSPVEVFSSHVLLKNKNGEPEMYCIDVDISDRKRIASELQHEQQFSKSILDSLPGIFYLYTYPECRLVLWNKQHETSLGYTAEEMIGRHVTEWQLPEAKDAVLKVIDEVMNAGQITIEAPLVAKDGHLVYFELTGVKFEVQNQSYFMGTGTDITARKRIEEALRISEERHRLLADNATDVIWTMDLEGHFTYVSPSVEKLRGYTSAEVMQQSLKEALTSQSIPLALDGLGRSITAVKAGLPIPEFRGELEQPCKNGSTVWTEVTTTGMRNSAGDFVGILGVSRDITDHKKMEDQVRQLAFHDALTNLPNRRLLNDRLAQATAASKRSGLYGALMFLDLDNFKPLNDSHGHEVGDLLLIEVADRLKRCVREMDTVARFGGDEFVVMISELEEDKEDSAVKAALIAEKIRIALAAPYVLIIEHGVERDAVRDAVLDASHDTEHGAEYDAERPKTVEHHCSASIGLTLFSGYEDNFDEILKRADMAMYQAKEAGRNAVKIALETPQRAGLAENVSPGFVQLAWHPSYECGNALIDEQHRALFFEANNLITAVLTERPAEELDESIDLVLRNVIRHFQDEEAILAEAGFSGAAAHASIHRQLIDRATTLAGRFHARTLGVGDLFQFLAYDVVARHILKADREFFPCLKPPA